MLFGEASTLPSGRGDGSVTYGLKDSLVSTVEETCHVQAKIASVRLLLSSLDGNCAVTYGLDRRHPFW